MPSTVMLDAKVELAKQLTYAIEMKGWTQTEAALQLSLDQPKVSALLRGRVEGFSTDRLLRLLNTVGRDVTIVVRIARRGEPGVSVVSA